MSLDISSDRGVRILRFSGPVSNESLMSDLEAFWLSDAYDDAVPELYDARDIEISKQLDGDGFAAIGRLNQDLNTGAPEVKVAIVVDSQLVYGLGRQAMPHLGDRYESERFQLFEVYEDAMAWLLS